MNTITFGSCMSEEVFHGLQRCNPYIKFSHINHVIHNRSDYFLKSFVEKSQPAVTHKSVLDADCDINVNFLNISLINELSFYIDNQSESKIGINRTVDRVHF